MRLIGLMHGLFGKLAVRGDLGGVLKEFLLELGESLGATGGFLLSATDPTNLRLLADVGPVFQEDAHDAEVIRAFYNEIFHHQRPSLAVGSSRDATCLIGVPLVSDERLIGGMVFFRAEGQTPFTLEDMPLLGVVALPLAIHLENVEISRVNLTRRAELEAVLSSMVDGLLVVDSWGLVVSFNEAFKQLAGLSAAELYTLYWDDLVETSERNSTVFESFNAALREGERFNARCAALMRQSNGKAIPVSISFTTIVEPSGRITGGVLSVRDVTIETQIDRMKDEFVSTVSHELRTPITSISGFVEMMMAREIPRADQLPLLEVIHSEAGRLGRLINDMLDLSKIQSNRLSLQLKKFRLETLLKSVIRPFEVQHAQSHRIALTIDPQRGMLLADYDRLAQVMVNLVSNAVKYSPEGGLIQVSAQKLRDRWVIEVRDEGIGIPEDSLPHVFDRFYRVNENQTSGSGLGLFITKEIVERHGGTIGIESRLNEGTTFRVTLPAIAKAQPTVKPVKTRSQSARAGG
ncbi:PAS domain S-box protein [bacterium]|nr:PAS domain S-box protein [bacterium]